MSYLDGAVSREAYNERVRLPSQTSQNLGVAATVALFARLYTVGFDGNVAIAAIVAIFLFVTAYTMPGNIEGEER